MLKATVHARPTRIKGVALTSYPAYRQTIGTLAERSYTAYRTALESEEAEAEQRGEAEAEAAAGETDKLRRRLAQEEAML